ncbi:MAG TPA: IS110 family transposase [Longimicrobiaceae bacterium]|nr:IS110 family transposase [Longimicrobiaceae bacterium]
MRTATTPKVVSAAAEPVLCVAFELSASEWKMAFSPGLGQQPRHRVVRAGELGKVQEEIARAKARFRLPADARVSSCYEAGREGFWVHRELEKLGIENLVVDSASIEVNRRARRAKTDRVDAGKLVGMLLRWESGDKKVFRVVRVPTVEEEDRRQLNRELDTAREDRGRVTNRIKSLLFAQGLRLEKVKDLPTLLDPKRLGGALPEMLRARLEREWRHVLLLEETIRELEAERRRLLRTAQDAGTECVRKLLLLGSIGVNSAWLFGMEFFSWRQFQNRRQIGGLAGLTPTPYQSGSESREQGICKAGNRWIRGIAIEIAWAWLRYQPNSELSRWYRERFDRGSKRLRKIGIVALARKLLIELWKYLQTGTPPAGAVLKTRVVY